MLLAWFFYFFRVFMSSSTSTTSYVIAFLIASCINPGIPLILALNFYFLRRRMIAQQRKSLPIASGMATYTSKNCENLFTGHVQWLARKQEDRRRTGGCVDWDVDPLLWCESWKALYVIQVYTAVYAFSSIWEYVELRNFQLVSRLQVQCSSIRLKSFTLLTLTDPMIWHQVPFDTNLNFTYS